MQIFTVIVPPRNSSSDLRLHSHVSSPSRSNNGRSETERERAREVIKINVCRLIYDFFACGIFMTASIAPPPPAAACK